MTLHQSLYRQLVLTRMNTISVVPVTYSIAVAGGRVVLTVNQNNEAGDAGAKVIWHGDLVVGTGSATPRANIDVYGIQ